MPLIKDSKGRGEKDTPSGYERVFGNKQLGQLFSKVHATAIREGNELEKILASKLRDTRGISIQDINKTKRIFKNIKKGHTIKIDCIVETIDEIKIIEIKDGDTFDTKKVAGEIESLEIVKEFLEKKCPNKKIVKVFSSFNATNHEQIRRGAKGLLDDCQPMTGRELCEILGVDFEEIVEERKETDEDNKDFLVEELKKISEIVKRFSK